ncbi:multicopper oxidase family protein [Bradyrhizobium sp. CCBAU 51753]|uniref:multicopper oxidase family protein n=1 Tax=Bradyrhizobium sp. CCBAU 51753 TaxID=1325100 RepID=UPI001FEF14D0|nr:multicopper oxidase family protein [Bradyrhizobium sp. CCBAU 51753]
MRRSSTLNRRSFIKAAGGFVGGTAAAGGLLSLGPSMRARSQPKTPAPEPLIQPPEISSANGMLDTAIAAAPGQVQLGDRAFAGLLYNGAYVPPILRVRLGDTLRTTFRNNLTSGLDRPGYVGPICTGSGTASNLHFHGMSVSPQGNSDNVFVHVQPGETFEYRVSIPAAGRQGPGLFWYHPHAHGFVDDQILGGMSGALVVDGIDQLFPLLHGLPERFFLIKHVKFDDEHELVSINGQINPAVAMRPGEMQFWRIAHIGASDFYKFRVEGVPLYVVATDGHALSQPRKVTEFFIGPGERIDAIAVGPPPGEYPMRTISFQNEAWRPPEPERQLAVIHSSGLSPGASPEDEILRQRAVGSQWIDDVRAAPIARRRTLSYSRTADRKVFMIGGRVVDEARIDQTVKLGDTEEWTVVNTDQQYHSFHIHQTPFLVTEVGGAPWNDDSLRDTFSVPPATDRGPGMLKVVIPFTDPTIVGRFVYHCHAVDHEDKGMMGVIEVVT